MTRLRIEPINRRAIAPLAPRIQQAIFAALEKEKEQLKKDFDLTVRTWKRKPVFVIRQSAGGSATTVSTDSDIYGYVNEGTRPHMIYPRKAKALRFYAGGFVSKTVPGVAVARKGKAANQNLTYSQGVKHPGFPGRNFTTLIKAKSDKRLAKELRTAIRKAVDRG